MPDQRDLEDKGGTMRLGLYPAKLLAGSKARAVYGTEVIYERHRHRFEVNNRYRQTLEAAGMLLSGTLAGRPAGGDRGAAGPPLVRGQPVPPGVQVPPGAPAPAVPRVRGDGPGAARRRGAAADGRGPRRRGWTPRPRAADPDANPSQRSLRTSSAS